MQGVTNIYKDICINEYMKNSNNLKKLSHQKKINVTLLLNEEDYKNFRVVMKDLKMNISGFLNELMPRVVDIGVLGGEVVFGVVPKGKDKEAFIKSILKDRIKNKEGGK